MAFDPDAYLASKPSSEPAFDPNVYLGVTKTPEIPGPRRTWTQTASEAVRNIPSSAAQFFGNVVQAVTSPVETAKGLGLAAAGGIAKVEQAVLPESVRNFVRSLAASPENYDQAVAAANAVGGFYKDRYGSVERLKNTLATDPVGAAADLSTLLAGGATAAGTVAPRSAAVLGTASRVIDPLTLPVKAVDAGMRGAAAAAGNIIDAARGERAAVRAGEIVRQAVTEEGRRPSNLPVLRRELQAAEPGLTATQAAAGMQAPQLQALGQVIESRAPGIAGITRQAQEAGRRGLLESVTPDLGVSIEARRAAAAPLYQAAARTEIPLDAGLQGLIDRMPSQVLNKARELAKIEDRPFMLEPPARPPIVSEAGAPLLPQAPARVTGETLHYIKRGLDDILSATGEKGLTKDLQRSVAQLREQYLRALGERIPAYGQARTTFAELSPPVNQAVVLNKLREILEQPLEVGERAAPFATALGRGEQGLIKKATGFPRFQELSDVLSPEQLKAVTSVKSELSREANIAQQAVSGRRALDFIMEANQYGFRLPGFFDAKVTLANNTLALLEGKLNAKVLKELENAFASGKNLDALIGKVPASQRIEVLRALGEASTKLSSAKPTFAGQFQAAQGNALAPTQQPQNALVQP